MRQRNKVLAMVAAACVGVSVPHRAAADEWDKQTTFTFSRDVEIPGKVLPAGTYVFKLADSPADRHVVQVFDENRRILATVLTIPAQRLRAADEPQIRFEEQPAGAPLPIKTWFYPGDLGGEEFVYPTHTN
jgi:Protein of unknown function (DUF2911)